MNDMNAYVPDYLSNYISLILIYNSKIWKDELSENNCININSHKK